MQEYVPQEIEAKWQKYWEEQGLLDFNFDSEKPQILYADHAALSLRRSTHWSLVRHGTLRLLCAFYENAGQRSFFPNRF